MSDDPRFDEWLDDARSSIDASVRDARREGAADFTAVLDEARRRDPERFAADRIERRATSSPVIGVFDGGDSNEDPVLDSFLDSARTSIEQDVTERRQRGIPTPPVVLEISAPHHARRRRLIGGLAAAAALGLLFLGARGWIAGVQSEGSSAREQALFNEARDDQVEQASSRNGGGEAAHRQPTSAEPYLESEPTLELAPAPAVEEHTSGVPGTTVKKQRNRRKSRIAAADPSNEADSNPHDRLRELDAQAQVMLKSGDWKGAVSVFEQITREGKGTRYADLAYGDLFTIARSHQGRDREAALWREYLSTYPMGRYADDASAGLCRREAAESQTKCWRSYLESFPDGIHKARATKSLDPAEETP